MGAVVALAVAGCAPHPPERAERDLTLLKAGEECARQFPGARVQYIDQDGRIHAQVPDHRDVAPYNNCIREAISRLGNGRLAAHAARASVTMEIKGRALLVPVLVNGVKATLLLDTGSTFTILRPDLARRAGIEPVQGGPRFRVVVAGGGQFSMPSARARSLGIHDAAVEAIDVGVYDTLPNFREAEGILGNNFLNHFTVTIDRQKRELILVPLPVSKPM
jgi:hypothetical protein